MKTLSILLSALCIYFPFDSFAQQTVNDDLQKDCCKQMNASKPAEAKKGYYSIGNNAKKLAAKQKNIASCTQPCANDNTSDQTGEEVTKGYYAISDNSTKLAGKNTNVVTEHAPKAVTKGYYAIGNHQSKLYNATSAQTCCNCCN